MNRKWLSLILSANLLAFITGCNFNRVYDHNLPIHNQHWEYQDMKKFEVAITDTSARYNIFVQLRHHFQFEWRNLWVKVGTRLPDGRELNERVNLILCEADGRWFGNCVGDECTILIPLQTRVIFPDTGTYTFTLTPDMRVNPLPHITRVGLRVEKI